MVHFLPHRLFRGYRPVPLFPGIREKDEDEEADDPPAGETADAKAHKNRIMQASRPATCTCSAGGLRRARFACTHAENVANSPAGGAVASPQVPRRSPGPLRARPGARGPRLRRRGCDAAKASRM